MAMTKTEFWIVTFISIIVSLILIMVVVNFSLTNQGNGFHREVVQRLERIELQKVPATARRFKSDDFLEFLVCMEIPYKDREPCLAKVRERFKEQK